MRHSFGAEVLSDSITPVGVRCTTLIATLPRAYLAELNTHRLLSRDGYEQELSRNSASSRAIPTEKNIDNVRAFPYVPETFNARVKGMGVGLALDPAKQEDARRAWMRGMNYATVTADILNEIGIDKSRANRVIEPFMWHTVIITATEWDNFLALRCPDGDEWDPEFPAQPEMQMFAIKIRDALDGSTPKLLEEGSWAMPYFDWDEESELLRGLLGGLQVPINEVINGALLVSARRVARVSFEKQDDIEDIMASYDKGIVLAQMAHYSPMEHQVRPITSTDLKNGAINSKIHVPIDLFRDQRVVNFKKLPLERMWCGNLRGVIQFRKLLPYEDNAAVKRAMEAAKEYEEGTR
jgi:hypothetical protein